MNRTMTTYREADDFNHGRDGRTPTERPAIGRETRTIVGSRSPTKSGTTAFEFVNTSSDDTGDAGTTSAEDRSELVLSGRRGRTSGIDVTAGRTVAVASSKSRPPASDSITLVSTA
jgi:hypothetical protein